MRTTPLKTAKWLVATCLLVTAAVTNTPATASVQHATIVSEDPVNYTPNVEDDRVVEHTSVDALAVHRDTLYAGGEFHLVQNSTRTDSYIRHNLMSFSATTGAMREFAPRVNGRVLALVAAKNFVYVGGYFTSVNGVARRGLAKIDATTGKVDRSFNAHLHGAVQEIRRVNGRLIVGGKFKRQLVALDPTTGDDTGYIRVAISGSVASNAGRTDIYRFAVNPAGTRLVAIGNFTRVSGEVRSRAFMLKLRASRAILSPWYYQPLTRRCSARSIPAHLRDVDFSPDGKYFVINSSGFVPLRGGVGRDLCDATARFETNVLNPTRPTWINYSGGDTFHSVAATGSAVYVQGHFRALDNPNGTEGPKPGSSPREGIGAIDPVTGKALPWNPGKTRAIGGKDMLATATGLWVGSDGARFGGEYRNNIAYLPL